MLEVGGLFGFILLVANIWAIVNVIGSYASTVQKVLWTLGILIFPFLGFIVWLIAGPRRSSAAA